MSTSPYGAFQPITDLAQRWGDKGRALMGVNSLHDLLQVLTSGGQANAAPYVSPTVPRPLATTWHDARSEQQPAPKSVFALKKGK